MIGILKDAVLNGMSLTLKLNGDGIFTLKVENEKGSSERSANISRVADRGMNFVEDMYFMCLDEVVNGEK